MVNILARLETYAWSDAHGIM